MLDPISDYVELALYDAWQRGTLSAVRDSLIRRGYPAESVDSWHEHWSATGAPPRRVRQHQEGLVPRTVRQPVEVWAHWDAEAAKLAVSVSVWLRLQCSAPVEIEPPADPVHGQSLWSKIHGVIGDTAIKQSAIKGLAKSLGVEARSIHAALGSRIASKRMVRDGDTYRPISKGE